MTKGFDARAEAGATTSHLNQAFVLGPIPRAEGLRRGSGRLPGPWARASHGPSLSGQAARLLAAIDGRLADGPQGLDAEVLGHLRQSLAAQRDLKAQQDVVLAETLAANLEHALELMADLEAGGLPRLRRLIAYCHELWLALRAGNPAASETFRSGLKALRRAGRDAARDEAGGAHAATLEGACVELHRRLAAALASLTPSRGQTAVVLPGAARA